MNDYKFCSLQFIRILRIKDKKIIEMVRMKYHFCFLILYLLCFNSFGQNVDYQSLQKYSYKIFGFYNERDSAGLIAFDNIQGTCFFFKKDNKTFLVSAKHTLTPWNNEKLLKNPFPDTLKLRLFDSSGQPIFYPIDVRKIKDTVTGGYFYNDPDIFLFEFKEAEKFRVNSIENFLISDNDSIGEVISFGFPSIKLVPGNVDSLIFQKATLTQGMIISQKEIGNPFSNLMYLIQRKDTLDKIGCSGSPVFCRKDSSDTWSFGGIFVRSSPQVPLSLILKSKFLFEQLKMKEH